MCLHLLKDRFELMHFCILSRLLIGVDLYGKGEWERNLRKTKQLLYPFTLPIKPLSMINTQALHYLRLYRSTEIVSISPACCEILIQCISFLDTFFSHPFLEPSSAIKKCEYRAGCWWGWMHGTSVFNWSSCCVSCDFSIALNLFSALKAYCLTMWFLFHSAFSN